MREKRNQRRPKYFDEYKMDVKKVEVEKIEEKKHFKTNDKQVLEELHSQGQEINHGHSGFKGDFLV